MNCVEYYGRLEPPQYPLKKKKRAVIYYMLKESEDMVLNALKEMEERIKGHAMECKRLIMHEIKKNRCKCEIKTLKEKSNDAKDGIHGTTSECIEQSSQPYAGTSEHCL